MLIDSPDYQDLKNKRFNTSFLREIPRGDRDIKIFTPEEDNSPRWDENVPDIRNEIRGIPGERYKDVFLNIPFDVEYKEEDEEFERQQKQLRKPQKRGRRKSHKVFFIPDECLLDTNAEDINLHQPHLNLCHPVASTSSMSDTTEANFCTRSSSSSAMTLMTASRKIKYQKTLSNKSKNK